MKHEVNIKWKENFQFDASVNGHKIRLDVGEDMGGKNSGPTPKPLMLVALAGCTGMDVVSILKKMHIEVEDFDVNVSAELTEEHPKQYYKAHITYILKGKNLSLEKIEKAVSLSQEKYCGVSAMLRKAFEITYDIKII